ncbi:MAG TPA: glycoside hydrolase family 2 TIM barrel-domain containing protein, partial [Chitinophagaceae bacterium]|nr:glycoside hydrolase family 2 TIM barrel-domain containing protein [Chitinophagaceae bacterium]
KENIIAVKVDNSQQINTRWYSGSGIYRHVWMMVANPVHIAQWGVAISTNAVTSKQATVQIKTIVKNETSSAQKISIGTNIFNDSYQSAGNNQTNIELAANSEKEIVQNIIVKNPSLWWPENPNLYTAKISISKSGKTVDETKTNFGIRTIKYSAETGFQLNGKTIKISGGCVHHDNGCLGSAAYDRAEERKIELLKAAGFNAVRTSHNPPSEAFLNACDKLGLLVMDESFDCWRWGKNGNDYAKYFNEWWKKDLQSMLLRDKNHPSIIMWSIGNEIVERAKPEAVATAKILYNEIKTIDTTRPITSAIVNLDKWENLDSLFNVHDVAGYNYHLNTAAADHLRVPNRIIVQTESYPKDAFANWKLVQENKFVIGDFVWTAIDYLGEAGIGRTYYTGETPGENWDNDMFPWHGSYCGDIDLIGNRKPISHYRSMLYNDNEKLYMAVREPNPEPLKIKETWWSVYPTYESWNWQGFEGKALQVEVYSKYPKVKLYLNDKLIDEKNISQENEFKATFSVPYSAGILKAVAVENDKEVETKILTTAGDAVKIKLTADRNKLVANGQDLCFVNIDITDKAGTLQPNAGNRLQFKIEGAGSIAGVANADMKDWDSYIGNSRKA